MTNLLKHYREKKGYVSAYALAKEHKLNSKILQYAERSETPSLKSIALYKKLLKLSAVEVQDIFLKALK